jgi:hypothetical protein
MGDETVRGTEEGTHDSPSRNAPAERGKGGAKMFKRLLSAELKVWHLLLVVVLLAVGTGTAVARQSAPPTDADSGVSSDRLFPSGAFKMAAAKSTTSMTVHEADGEVTVLQVGFSVPSGRKADIAAFFNAEAYKYPNGYCYVTFYLDGVGTTALAPGQVWGADGYVYSGAYPTISAQGYKAKVGPGAHSVLVTLDATGGDCYVDDRSVILISNQH